MLDLTRVIREVENRSDHVRYRGGREVDAPVSLVVWNTTPACNLTCQHCYFAACDERAPDEFSTAEAREFVDHLGDLGVPGLVLSGGEPFFRDDIAEIARHATENGIRVIGSSNGTFLTEERARAAADAGMRYVGVSLDGIGETHDRFRGMEGAFDRALSGLRNASETDMATGIRFTITEDTVEDLPDVIDLAVEEGVDRLTVFHLIHVGRGVDIVERDLPDDRRRAAIDHLYERTREIVADRPEMRVITGGNAADAVYLYYRIAEDLPDRADRAHDLLFEEGSASGITRDLVNVDHRGDVYPSMGMTEYTLGNVRERPLDEILETSDLWSKLSNPLDHLQGRCGECPYRHACRGNSRARADVFHGDLWASDPQCYLTDAELGLAPGSTPHPAARADGSTGDP